MTRAGAALVRTITSIGNSMTCSGIWRVIFQNCSKILKYYEPLLLPNTTCRSCYYLFIIEAEKFSVTRKRPFFLRLKKTNTGVYDRNNFFNGRND